MKALHNWRFLRFSKDDIVGAPLAGASVAKMAILLGVSRAAFFKVMMTYKNHGKISSAKRKSCQKQKIS